jgi:dipeptidyl aminopeptidase/acylaminoacyl peptidase
MIHVASRRRLPIRRARPGFRCLAALALVLLPACISGGHSGSHPVSDMVPLAAIMGNRPAGPRRSPDGTRVAELQPGAGPGHRMNLFVTGPDGQSRQVTQVEDQDLSRFDWLDNGRLVYYREPEGYERWRLWMVNADGGDDRELTPPGLTGVTTRLVAFEPGGTGFLRLAIGNPAHYDLYRVHPGTGEWGQVERGPQYTALYSTDPDGRVLLATTFDGRTTTLYRRDREGEPFRPMLAATYPDFITPIKVMQGGTHAVVCTNLQREYAVIGHLRLADGVLDHVRHEFPDRDLYPREEDLGLALDEFPGALPFFRTGLADVPNLVGDLTFHLVSYRARDGLAIPAFLYLPKDRGQGRWPAVVLCHGGPSAQNVVGDAWAVLLASRGLAVICPDFRGSTGYGKTFQARGFGQWGRAMQDDLTDAAAWLVQEGYARADRIGIVGGSYGGYAALAGAAFTPDTFRCAVSLAGISDLRAHLDGCWSPVQRDFMQLYIGGPAFQGEDLGERSPALHADRIKIPVLLGHGGRDPRVSPAQSEQMVKALRDRGAFVPYLTFPEEGHGFGREENRMQFFRVVENFLGLHLGSRVEAWGPYRLAP